MKIKRILAATLAATMVMGSALTVCATTVSSGSGSSYTAPKTYAEKHTQESGALITVGGVKVATSVSGVYTAKSVKGTAIKTDLATVKANLGLTNGQNPVVTIYDTDAKKSNLAMACVDAAVEALGGGDVVACIDVNLFAKQKGKVVTLKDGSVAMAVGLPKTADTTKTYSIICVQPGGVVTVFEDLDTNPNTVTFNVQAGLGTYALVAR